MYGIFENVSVEVVRLHSYDFYHILLIQFSKCELNIDLQVCLEHLTTFCSLACTLYYVGLR